MNCEAELNGITSFIYNEVTHAKKKGCVVGVSGGIDSAVIATICARIFPNNTYGILLPAKNTIFNSSVHRAINLVKALHIEWSYVEIPTLVTINKKALGNYHARMRMATLYFFAEELDCLVIGTDNKSESYLGYFTKFGDGGVDINPIGQYFKSEVYELARYLGVSSDIINAAPSAELWEGQTDEKELGLSYDEIENCIRSIENNVDKEFFTTKEIMLIEKVHKITEHKRNIPNEYIRER